MLNRATLIAAILGPLFVGALIVTAIMADRQTRTVTTVRYVTETQYVTVAKPARVVYVDLIVEVPVETGVQVTLVEAPVHEPVAPPEPEPPVFQPPAVALNNPPPNSSEPPESEITLAACDPPGRGVGKAVGWCRKQGFPK